MELIEGISHNMIDVFHDGVHSTYVGNGPVISQTYRDKLPGDNHGDLPCVVSHADHGRCARSDPRGDHGSSQ